MCRKWEVISFFPRTGSPLSCLWRLCRIWARPGQVKRQGREQLTFNSVRCSVSVISCNKSSLLSILQMKKQTQKGKVT